MGIISKTHQLYFYILVMYRNTNLKTQFKRAKHYCKNYTMKVKIKKLKTSVSGDRHRFHELKLPPHPKHSYSLAVSNPNLNRFLFVSIVKWHTNIYSEM